MNNNTSLTLQLLFVAFVVLKLTKVITWSWWWVCAPLWMPFIGIAVFILVGTIFVVSTTKRKR